MEDPPQKIRSGHDPALAEAAASAALGAELAHCGTCHDLSGALGHCGTYCSLRGHCGTACSPPGGGGTRASNEASAKI